MENPTWQGSGSDVELQERTYQTLLKYVNNSNPNEPNPNVKQCFREFLP